VERAGKERGERLEGGKRRDGTREGAREEKRKRHIETCAHIHSL